MSNNNKSQQTVELPQAVNSIAKEEHTSVLQQMSNSPDIDLSPSVVNMIKAKKNEIELSGNDLGAYAMDTCVAQNGNIKGFKNVLNVVVMNYKVEAERMEQDVKIELSTEINRLNNLIIKLTNEIHSIETFVIPEKQEELKSQENQIISLMNNSEYNVSSSLSSERLLIMQLAAARTKEIIRELKKKVVELQTEIDQTKIAIEGLNMQSQQINFFNESVLRRRLALFLNHWLIALSGMGVDETLIAETEEVFKNYQNNQIALLAA
jgi:uncharacterized coiled-coil protein SlyX